MRCSAEKRGEVPQKKEEKGEVRYPRASPQKQKNPPERRMEVLAFGG